MTKYAVFSWNVHIAGQMGNLARHAVAGLPGGQFLRGVQVCKLVGGSVIVHQLLLRPVVLGNPAGGGQVLHRVPGPTLP